MASDHYVWLAWSIVFLVLWGIIFASFPDERRKMGVGEQWNTSIPKSLTTTRCQGCWTAARDQVTIFDGDLVETRSGAGSSGRPPVYPSLARFRGLARLSVTALNPYICF